MSDSHRGNSHLLFNMSAQPTAVLTHRADRRFLLGQRVAFCLRSDFRCEPACLLERLDARPWHGPPTAAEELRRRIAGRAPHLPLPAAAAALDSAESYELICDELLDVLTVLAKSSAHVYVRDKEPNLAALRPGRRVVLLLPPEKKP